MSSNPYSTTKLAQHPDRIEAFRRGAIPAPVLIHLMPQNLCNADCHYCSYRLSNWKNSEQFDDKQQIPWTILEPALRDAAAMGTKAIELTGGGEPTIYSKFDETLDLIHELGLDLGLVTNGVAMTDARVGRLGSVRGWKWARVSIEAADVETYCKVRSVPPNQWDRAWAALRNLSSERDRRKDPEIRVGSGYVVTQENFGQVFSFCRMARDAGADNVRLSLRFGPGGNDYYLPGQLDEAERQAARARADLSSEKFRVVDLIPERRANQDSAKQDYDPCYSMRLICVIGGDAKVYTCCTLAFSPGGEIGDLRNESFRKLWQRNAETNFGGFSVRERCACQCLYEKRNKAMIAMIKSPLLAIPDPDQVHANFP